VEQEHAELKVLQRFLPEPLTEGEIKRAIQLRSDNRVHHGCKILGRYRKSDAKDQRPTYGKKINESAREILLGPLIKGSFCLALLSNNQQLLVSS
jgi:uncharacterized protein YqeY